MCACAEGHFRLVNPCDLRVVANDWRDGYERFCVYRFVPLPFGGSKEPVLSQTESCSEGLHAIFLFDCSARAVV